AENKNGKKPDHHVSSPVKPSPIVDCVGEDVQIQYNVQAHPCCGLEQIVASNHNETYKEDSGRQQMTDDDRMDQGKWNHGRTRDRDDARIDESEPEIQKKSANCAERERHRQNGIDVCFRHLRHGSNNKDDRADDERFFDTKTVDAKFRNHKFCEHETKSGRCNASHGPNAIFGNMKVNDKK